MGKLIGGWTQSLTQKPLREFDINMYGMVTNLDRLVTEAGWGPGTTRAPRFASYESCKIFWTYGGQFCGPEHRPANEEEAERIAYLTIKKDWDGVDFDDEGTMNIDYIISAMDKLHDAGKGTSYGFITGWNYNNPGRSAEGDRLNRNIERIAYAGVCDRFIHYCYGDAMWTRREIEENVRSALKRTIRNGVPKRKIILALTTVGLNYWNLGFFLDQVVNLDIGGLFIWNYGGLTDHHRHMIRTRLN